MTEFPPNPNTIFSPERPEDAGFMRLAFAEARRAWGRTSPNPMVGCVLVRDGQIIGRGHHAKAGQAHAEVAALADARARGEDPRGCTAYVSLEPCCVFGRTPPCTKACIESGVVRVVAATVDPNDRVRGKGLARLREAGIEVTCGVLESEARRLIAPFATRVLEGRPHVTVKVATGLDGKMATRSGDSFPLTGPEARRAVHQLRDRIDAILVGRGTVECDNPRLTCRLDGKDAGPGGPRDPVRVVVDPMLSAPLSSKIFHLHAKGQSAAPTWVAVDASMVGSERALALSDLGVEVIGCPRLSGGGLDLGHLLRSLAERGVCSLLVEGGARTLTAFVEAGLVDVWIAHIAPVLVGGVEAPSPLGGAGAATMDEVLRPGGEVMRRLLGVDTEIAMPLKGDVYGID